MTEFGSHELDPLFDVVSFFAPGTAADLTNCDREPIHLSGAIQPHGVLLGVAENDLSVQVASANTSHYLGVEAAALLGAPLARALGDDAVQQLRVALTDPMAVGADPQTCQLPGGASFGMTWHRVGGQVLAELEPVEPTTPVSMSAHFVNARRALDALHAAEDVSALCGAAAIEVKRLTGYDRVLIYRFHPDEHGEVVAEQREPEMEPFLGLHYPASDIPRQARKLYLLNHLRVIADVDYQPVPLLGVAGDAVNLSSAGLRSVSPVHLEYLRAMGVQATLTMSIMRGTRLWGMIACHHRTAKRIDPQVRPECLLLAQALSLAVVNQERVEQHTYRSRLADIERQIIARMSGGQPLADAFAADQSAALEVTDAKGMVAHIDGRTVTAGTVPPAQIVTKLLTRLCADEVPAEFISDELPRRFDEFTTVAEHATGVLALPLSAGYQDYVLWFRGEWAHDRRWAGDPDKPMTGHPNSSTLVELGPRKSFAAWTQHVRGRCRPWLAAEIETARSLASAVPELQLTRAHERLAHRALHDPLTGLPNQAMLLARTDPALERQGDGEGAVALLVIDLDHFGQVNETLGSATGDRLLEQVAIRLAATLAGVGSLAHAGGDDFIVLCEGVSVERAAQLANRIVQDFRQPFLIAGHRILATASIGFAVADGDATAAGLLRDADTAMSRMKGWGRNGAVHFSA